MGSCISKCHRQTTSSISSSQRQTIPQQQNLVISQSPIPNNLPRKHPTLKAPPYFPSTSSSSFSSPSCTTTTTTRSTTTATSTSSFSSSTASYSSCKQRNPHIVILDWRKPQMLDSESPRQTRPCKRARSSSPSLARLKSLTEPRPIAGAATSSPRRRSVAADIEKVGTVARKEKKLSHFSNPGYNRRSSSGVRRRETETRVDGVDPLVCGRQKAETNQERRCRTPVMDELVNPLITMDCFIFL